MLGKPVDFFSNDEGRNQVSLDDQILYPTACLDYETDNNKFQLFNF